MSTPPPFIPFDPHEAARIYRGNLPHWRQKGVTYFVTCRLGDSLPTAILLQWRMEQRYWLKSHGITWDPDGCWKRSFERLEQSAQREFEKRFTYAIQHYLDDGYGSCLLRQPALRALADNAFAYFHSSRFWLGDYVCMPNHCHALITTIANEDLEGILGSIKGYSARRINRKVGRSGKSLWQRETFDHIVRDLDHLKAFRRYIAENPVKANLKKGQFTYRRASWMDAWQ